MKHTSTALAFVGSAVLLVGPPGVRAQATGTITGTVTLEPPPPPRRSASRYAGGSQRIQIMQQTQAVVFLRGAPAGAPPSGYDDNPQMVQQDSLFVPSTIALMVGGTVDFPNSDPIFHNVFSYSSAKRFDLGRYPQGESRSVTFDQAGIVEVGCEVHDHMAGAIVVTENPWHAVAGEGGTFVIGGVPPGEYTLVAWHAEHDQEERTVTVEAGGTTRIEVELRR